MFALILGNILRIHFPTDITAHTTDFDRALGWVTTQSEN